MGHDTDKIAYLRKAIEQMPDKKSRKIALILTGLTGLIAAVFLAILFSDDPNTMYHPVKTQTFLTNFSRPEKSQAYANITGANFESHVEFAIKNAGFSVIDQNDDTENPLPNRHFRKNVKYSPPYGNGTGISDGVLHINDDTIRIEAMWMQSKGSTDFKLGHTFNLATQEVYPENTIVLIADGPGWRKNFIATYKIWAKNHNRPFRTKILIFSLDEFIVWIGSL